MHLSYHFTINTIIIIINTWYSSVFGHLYNSYIATTCPRIGSNPYTLFIMENMPSHSFTEAGYDYTISKSFHFQLGDFQFKGLQMYVVCN